MHNMETEEKKSLKRVWYYPQSITDFIVAVWTRRTILHDGGEGCGQKD